MFLPKPLELYYRIRIMLTSLRDTISENFKFVAPLQQELAIAVIT